MSQVRERRREVRVGESAVSGSYRYLHLKKKLDDGLMIGLIQATKGRLSTESVER